MARLLFCGQTVLDCVFDVDRVPLPVGKSVARSASFGVGGLAANAARAAVAARADPRTSIVLASAVGDDAPGRMVLEALSREGIDPVHVAIVPGARTSATSMVVDATGERQLVNDRGTALAHAPLPAGSLAEACDGLLVDPRWPEAASALLERARERGIVTVLDAELAASRDLHRLAPLADWVVFSSAGLAAWAGVDVNDLAAEAELERVAAKARRAELVVTRGGAGATWRRASGELLRLPAFDVEVIDSNGAGDALHGALLLALVEGREPVPALRFAMAAGALACTRRAGFANRDEIEAVLSTAG